MPPFPRKMRSIPSGPAGKQLAYLDQVVVGTANRARNWTGVENAAVGWDLSRISRLTRAICSWPSLRYGWRMYLWALRLTWAVTLAKVRWR